MADTALEYRTLPPVRALVTAAVQRGLCTAAELAYELEAGPRNHSAVLRAALKDVRDGARSIAEAEAIGWLRQARVPDFEANAEIADASGSVVAIADLLWRDLRAIAEIDSREFHFSELDWKRTLARHNRLTSLGFAVAHFTPAEVRGRRELWADEVASWLRCRARELGVPYRAAHPA